MIKGVVRETIENKAKEQKGGFLGMLLNTLAAGLFGTMLADKPKIPGWRIITACEGVIRATILGIIFWHFLMFHQIFFSPLV